jgi:hypothetical protein
MDSLTTRFSPPPAAEPGRTRASFGLPPKPARLYMAPYTLHKLHPGVDAAIAAILRRDPSAYVILLRSKRREWSDALQVRRYNLFMQRMDAITYIYTIRGSLQVRVDHIQCSKT